MADLEISATSSGVTPRGRRVPPPAGDLQLQGVLDALEHMLGRLIAQASAPAAIARALGAARAQSAAAAGEGAEFPEGDAFQAATTRIYQHALDFATRSASAAEGLTSDSELG